MRTIRKICHKDQLETEAMRAMIIADAPLRYRHTLNSIHVFVTDTRRGRARHADNTATIPLWAKQRGVDYFNYYMAHELAHHVCFRDYDRVRGHGPIFQEVLQELTTFAHFELEYKPRFASAAGISKPQE